MKLAILALFLPLAGYAHAGGNLHIKNFDEAKRLAVQVHAEHPFTIYCGCKYEGKRVDLKSCGYKPKHRKSARASRLEWEHVVPAENFGKSFTEWRLGSKSCIKDGKPYKGRKCAEKNEQFNRMEADLYNLWPEDGELNGLRNNYSMAELGAEKHGGDFGGCRAKIEDRKFEPMPDAKGRVARVYLYMEQAYPGHGIVSDKNRKLFEAWDKLHPVDPWECKRAQMIAKVQGNENEILKSRCFAH